MSIDKIAKDFESVSVALFDLFADTVDENGDGIIMDSDTLDDYIEIMDIMSRVESRKIRELKFEYESIM